MTVLASSRPDAPGTTVQVLREGKPVATVASYAEQPVLTAHAAADARRAHGGFRAPSCCRPGTGSRTDRFRC